MSVYIPDIAPPESCDECTHPTCTLWQNREPDGRHEDCPLIEVPPHGRLIDADALLGESQKDGAYDYISAYDIDRAKTVIPGDRKV